MATNTDFDETNRYITYVPNYGFKIKLNHVYPEYRTPLATTTWRTILAHIPIIYRYLIYFLKHLYRGTIPATNLVCIPTALQIYGAPIGGIGGGTIGRGFRGEFCRYSIIPGMYQYKTVEANQFMVTIKTKKGETIFHSLLSTFPKQKLSTWKSKLDPEKCKYTALYPRAWTEYDLTDYGIRLTCRQITPVIPHNYKDSSLPCAVFVWEVENVCDQNRRVTISFMFRNGIGNDKFDTNGICYSESFSHLDTKGVLLHNTINDLKCTYAISSQNREDVNITECMYFDPNSDGQSVWKQLEKYGKFIDTNKTCNETYNEMGCGIATQITVAPKETKNVENSLVWHSPIVTFPLKRKKRKRYYTKFFNKDLTFGAIKISEYCLKNYKKWETDIYKWQKHVLDDSNLPDWYKGALFNEAYYIADGGTIWFDIEDQEKTQLAPHDPRIEFGQFGYLEGHEYKMYNTYDVHYNASFAFSMNWPEIQNVIQYEIKDAIFKSISGLFQEVYSGKYIPRKTVNTVPHDVGDPNEPFLRLNTYYLHDVSQWRDLNPKFVLQVYRDYCVHKFNRSLTANQYLEDMYEACKVVMEHTLKFDRDGDGLIENDGGPETTYDIWLMKGPSTYCCGLWLAALQVLVAMCEKLKKTEDRERYKAILYKGVKSLQEKLWNGVYYKYDYDSGKDTIMADQLSGHWYIRYCGFKYEIFPENNVKSTLKAILDNNVKKYSNGKIGVGNGVRPNGEIDKTCLQSEETWIGITYGIVANMIQEGMEKEAWIICGDMYKYLTEEIGMAFNTPEALSPRYFYRSMGYMRPLSIWSIQLALEQKKNLAVNLN